MTLHKKFTIPSTAVLVVGSLLATTAPGHAAETQLVPTLNASTSENLLQSPEQAKELLRAIDQIPESVLLEGDEATQRWVAANLGRDLGMATPNGFLECSGAILLAIGTTAIPAAKILKIKRYMNALGGTTEAIKILWGASFSHEKLKALGGAAAALGAELLGIAAVKEACTN
ncbi:MAG: hypothetical protein Q4C74_02580 [Rothia sp. (in: high G+C Gram-positive bacteria)]|nr:hypothetical protein [Rothia sp. (in: high G+C Gram-positive bacteria)]